MDLLDRYLAAIGGRACASPVADIETELRGVLLSRVEAMEERLRRPLSGPEVSTLLTQLSNEARAAVARLTEAWRALPPATS